LLNIFSSAPAVSDIASKLKLNTWFSPSQHSPSPSGDSSIGGVKLVHEPDLLAVSAPNYGEGVLSEISLDGEEASFVQEGWKSVELTASSLNVLGSPESSFVSAEESGSGLLTPVAVVSNETSCDFFLSPIDACEAELVASQVETERVTLQLIVPVRFLL